MQRRTADPRGGAASSARLAWRAQAADLRAKELFGNPGKETVTDEGHKDNIAPPDGQPGRGALGRDADAQALRRAARSESRHLPDAVSTRIARHRSLMIESSAKKIQGCAIPTGGSM